MNPLFWVLMVLVALAIWIAAIPLFSKIGAMILDVIESWKDEIRKG